MKKLLFILGLFISLNLFGQSKTHCFLFTFDTKAVAWGKNTTFSNPQFCNANLTLFDRASFFLLDDPVAVGIFDIKNVEKDYERNIFVFTCTKRETKESCTILLENEFITFIYASVAYRYHIRLSNELD